MAKSFLSDTQVVSIRTPFNRPVPKSTPDTRRVLRNGRWVRVDPQAGKALSWLRS